MDGTVPRLRQASYTPATSCRCRATGCSTSRSGSARSAPTCTRSARSSRGTYCCASSASACYATGVAFRGTSSTFPIATAITAKRCAASCWRTRTRRTTTPSRSSSTATMRSRDNDRPRRARDVSRDSLHPIPHCTLTRMLLPVHVAKVER